MNNKQQKEANQFAMELLMPRDMVRKEIKAVLKEVKGEQEIVKTMAKKFAVEEYLMTLRLNQLGLFKNY